MNRETAKDDINRTYDSYYSTTTPDLEHCLTVVECEELVDKIYDSFENRTCDRCEYLQGKDKESKCVKGYLPDNLYEDDFGCNKFKEKK